MPASTRGSSWATSATTNRQPVVGDRRGPDLHRDRQRSAAVGRPPAGDHAAGQERTAGTGRRAPSCPARPSRWPRAAGTSFLYSQQRRRCPGASSCSQGPRAGVGHRQPRASAARAAARPGESGFSPGAPKRRPDLGRQRARAPPAAAPRGGRGPSSSASSRSCTSARHGSPACGHLGGDQRAGGLGGEQQPEPAALGRRGQRRQLPGVLGGGVEPVGRVLEREERRVGRRHRLQRVPARRLVAGQQRPGRRTGDRRSTAWLSRRSVQRSTRTPAASSAGYHRVVSSHTQRTGPAAPARRTNAGELRRRGSRVTADRRPVVRHSRASTAPSPRRTQEDAVHPRSLAEGSDRAVSC